MLNLIKLEIKKMKVGSVLLSFIGINLGIISLLLLLGIDPEAASEFLTSYESVFMLIEMFVVAASVIYASVLLSSMIIEEFKDKTITVLFMYPVNRKKILLSKLTIISFITFFFVSMSNIIVFLSFYYLNTNLHYISAPLTQDLLMEKAIHIFVISIACAGMSLIPLLFGMIKHSVSATVISSILIVAILSSSTDNGTNLFSFVFVPIILGVSGFVIAYAVINKAVKADL
ncbi:ABC transporter permease [Gracilibacillus massiliensis]|uniref:ABC transporter permease n=1 Tax=Gracilibacillus massiliensis TaxID=1564956 RepID=UPI00071D0C01|nr:ABC transporter permease [Gracilibacillus massiliensis]